MEQMSQLMLSNNDDNIKLYLTEILTTDFCGYGYELSCCMATKNLFIS